MIMLNGGGMMRKISLLLCLLIVLTSFSSVTVLAAHDPYMGIEMTAYDDAVDADSSFSIFGI